jgi:hypothetical protein
MTTTTIRPFPETKFKKIDWKFSIIKPKIFFTDLVLHKLAGKKNI